MRDNSEKATLSPETICTGDDISKHYLDTNNKNFKIYRYKQNVYAVRYDHNKRPIDFVHMWHSHNKEKESTLTSALARDKDTSKLAIKLGEGIFGEVEAKTEDKAVKKSKNNRYENEQKARKINTKLLEQKFFLKEHGLEQLFVFGLWNIKNPKDLSFIMPRMVELKPLMWGDEGPKIVPNYKENRKRDVEAMILDLKKLNDLGYGHGDLALNPRHNSPQNMISTKEGIKLIDLDSGLYTQEKLESDFINQPDLLRQWKTYLKDQWLYVYNYEVASGDSKDTSWRHEIIEWYEGNNYTALSDSPKELYRLYQEKKIKLPNKLVMELVRDLGLAESKQSHNQTIETQPKLSTTPPNSHTQEQTAKTLQDSRQQYHSGPTSSQFKPSKTPALGEDKNIAKLKVILKTLLNHSYTLHGGINKLKNSVIQKLEALEPTLKRGIKSKDISNKKISKNARIIIERISEVLSNKDEANKKAQAKHLVENLKAEGELGNKLKELQATTGLGGRDISTVTLYRQILEEARKENTENQTVKRPGP